MQIDKEYRFATDNGIASLKDLFKDRSQLLVYHFMFGPEWAAGCPNCSGIADGFNGIFVHLENHDIAFTAVSRAPLTMIQAYKRRMGWKFPWASSHGGDFNYDYSTSFTDHQQREGIVFNFSSMPEADWRAGESGSEGAESQFAAMCGVDVPAFYRERSGVSAFALQGGVVFHTYSAYSRGLDALWGMYPWLDRAPKGRNESGGPWWRRHDEYDKC